MSLGGSGAIQFAGGADLRRLWNLHASLFSRDCQSWGAELCAILGRIGGVEAVTIVGSRAAGTAGERSDWDVGVYCRVRIDLAPSLASERCTRPAHGARIMNGGAWLSLERTKVGVLLRDLDVTMYWSGRAR